MSIFSRIFGAEEAINKAGDIIDEAFYTDDEKASNDIELYRLKAEYKIETLKAYEPFKLAQRVLAFSFTSIYMFILSIGIICYTFGISNDININNAKDFADSMYLGEIVLTIVAFYFGGGAINSFKKVKNDKI